MNLKRKNKLLTNYYKRIKYIESNKDRLVVRFTNRYIIASLFEFKRIGDYCKLYQTTKHLKTNELFKDYASLKNKFFAFVFALSLSKSLQNKDFIIDTGLYAPKNKENLKTFINAINFFTNKTTEDFDSEFYTALTTYFKTDKDTLLNNYARLDS